MKLGHDFAFLTNWLEAICRCSTVIKQTNVINLANVTYLNSGHMIVPVKDFGKRFREWRDAKGVSGWAIEKAVGLSRSNLSSLEAGRYIPSDEVLKDIATIPELELSFLKLRAWKALSEYSIEELEAALNESKSKKPKK